MITAATLLSIGIAKIIEDLELPAPPCRGVSDDAFEFRHFRLLAFFEFDEIDLQLLERRIGHEQANRSTAKGRNVVEAAELHQLAQRSIESFAIQFGFGRQLLRLEVHPLEAPLAHLPLDNSHHLPLRLGFTRQEFDQRWQITVQFDRRHVLLRRKTRDRATLFEHLFAGSDAFGTGRQIESILQLLESDLDRIVP